MKKSIKFKIAKAIASVSMSIAEAITDASCRIINTQLPDDKKIFRDTIVSDKELNEAFQAGFVEGKRDQRKLDRIEMENEFLSGYNKAMYEISSLIQEEAKRRSDAEESRIRRRREEIIESCMTHGIPNDIPAVSTGKDRLGKVNGGENTNERR